MTKHMWPGFMMMVAMTLLMGLVYPLAITGIAQTVFPSRANGSLIEEHGRVIGSALIGQQFLAADHFHGRPSATTPAYNAASSGASNLGPTSAALAKRVSADAAKLQAENPAMKVPEDLVTASASGLDPDITPAAALFQVPRVAKASGIAPAQLAALVRAHVDDRALGIWGEPHVNVLELNLALDRMAPRRPAR